MSTQEPITFLRLKDVCQRTGLSGTHIYRMEAKGRFPKRVHLSEATTVWVETEVQQWCAERIAASRVAA
ncbi:AlpA family transcriptional regulator [Luteibacter jiangsuensis]|uniref:AlpA family transcriptional regulator n=1 Tax=Luteibacter jiangsuensis TaxID=637577 RepID=A0ABX0QBM0_9GAMM|nr:AlpA family transcriptional regulator [Luteibacter jiangsuensis]NID06822.1 AlpA family transcriptional regulator [Luteibacter jiangsuensis]